MSDLRTALDRTTPTVALIDIGAVKGAARRRKRVHRAAGAGAAALVVGGATFGMAELADPGARSPQFGSSGYDVAIGTWSKTSASPLSARTQAIGAELPDGRILVWGGRAEARYVEGGSEPDPALTARSDGAIYDPKQDRWTSIPEGPVGFRRDGGGLTMAVGHGNRFAVATFVGVDQTGLVAVFDVNEGRWVSAPEIPGRDPGVNSDNRLGFDGETVTFVRILDPIPARVGVPAVPRRLATVRWSVGDAKWTEGTPAPIEPRFNAGIGVSGDGTRLVVWGGMDQDPRFETGSPTATLFGDGAVYEVTTDTWSPLPDLGLPPATSTWAGWVDDRLVIGGGVVRDADTGSDNVMTNVGPIRPQTRYVMVTPSPGQAEAVTPEPLDVGSSISQVCCGAPLLRGDGTLVVAGDDASGSGGAERSRYLGKVTGYRWSGAPDADVRSSSAGTYVTSVSRANPGDRPFAISLAHTGGGWQSTATASFPNRMDATVVRAGRYVLVTGGEEGRDLRSTDTSWLLTLPEGSTSD